MRLELRDAPGWVVTFDDGWEPFAGPAEISAGAVRDSQRPCPTIFTATVEPLSPAIYDPDVFVRMVLVDATLLWSAFRDEPRLEALASYMAGVHPAFAEQRQWACGEFLISLTATVWAPAYGSEAAAIDRMLCKPEYVGELEL